MEFEARFYGDRLRLVNPAGDVGVVTLWSDVERTLDKLRRYGIDLDGTTSRIAAVGNLYGNGLPHLLRNLLWNPQVAHLLVVGHNLSGSREQLLQFFAAGLERTDLLGSSLFRIRGTERVIDGMVTPADFAQVPRITTLGTPRVSVPEDEIKAFFAGLPAPRDCAVPRREFPLPEVKVSRCPSEPGAHTIVRCSPLEAWRELIFRLVRFGHRVELEKGVRYELQGVKVVITRPVEDPDAALRAAGFDPERFRRYQEAILRPAKPDDLAYTYGHRLRGYFSHEGAPVDALAVAIRLLKQDPESRHAFASLWDTHRDTPEAHGCPCLVSLFFRRFEGALTLLATFRTHNAMDAWPENLWGLIAIQRYVADKVGMPPGPITVNSYSISVAADSLARAQAVAQDKVSDEVVDPETGKRGLRFDPNGNFVITIDKAAGEIIAQHEYEGVVLNEYRGKSAAAIEQAIARDCAISEISHALFVGRELAKAQYALKRERH